ncbi:MAG: SulP family inorganic anion transporter [Acidimicrobiales bacterium]
MSGTVADLAQRWRNGLTGQVADLRSVPAPTAGDVVGGVSVALVLIPQSLAYAGLAGLPPFVGLFASAFPLIVFAILSSSPYLQTGPVALTSLLTAGALAGVGLEAETADYVAAAALLAAIVGLARLMIGALRLGSVVYLMAEPVMIGFTSGAGIVILSSQLPKALGVGLPADVADWSNPIARALWAVVHPGDWEAAALVISAITLLLMLRGRKLHRLFPGVLVAVALALLFSRTTNYDGAVVGDIDAGIPGWSLDLPWSETGSLIVGGLVIALVGFAEPASIARTFANEEQSSWSSSREFFASGLANITAGLTGAFPVGGSFSRSSVNRFAGANTRWSGAITGAVVLAFLPFAGLLAELPNAVLGAIVVGAVLGLIKPRRLVGLVQRSPWQGGLGIVTFVATLLTPPNVQWAVLLGVGLTGVLHVWRRFELERVDAAAGELHLRPRGLLWVATTAALRDELMEAIEADRGRGPITVDLARSTAIDASIAASIAAGAGMAHDRGREFRVINAPPGATPILEGYAVHVV